MLLSEHLILSVVKTIPLLYIILLFLDGRKNWAFLEAREWWILSALIKLPKHWQILWIMTVFITSQASGILAPIRNVLKECDAVEDISINWKWAPLIQVELETHKIELKYRKFYSNFM